MNIKLDNRLLNIANLVDDCKTIADIGCDHGYIPIYLLQNNKCDMAYACDVALLPLNKAKENVKNYNLENKVKFVLTNGLQGLDKDIDTIIIAGMGGYLISSILESNNYKYQNLILEPNQDASVVRKMLVKLGYTIIDEKIVLESKKYYEIIKAILKQSSLSDLEIKYGPINLKNKSKEFYEFYSNKIRIIEKVISTLEKNSNAYKEKLNELNELKLIIKE